jgi:hypothetical protein
LTFTTELKVPPEPAFATLVEAFVADAARRSGVSGEKARGLVEASTDSFARIAGSGLIADRDPVHCVASCTPLRLQIALVERGLPMDDTFARRRFRWSELTRAVETVHWCCHGTGGSELRLTVQRPHAIAVTEMPARQAEEAVPRAPEQEYVIRRFEPSDAPGVARAFYQTYGYAYDLPAVYDPRRLTELNQSGHYISIVAVTAGDEVVGHYALARDAGAPVADACGAVVVPEHRGRNLLNRLRDAAESEAIALGLCGYYSEPVTDHPRTQSASESFGAKACGITLGEAPRNFLARHMELSATAQRQSCMLYVKALKPREVRPIYAPPQHRAIIERIYSELGLAIAMADGAVAQTASGVLHSSISHADRTGAIDIETIGLETVALVGQAVEDLRNIRRLGAVYISLPLENPGTAALCEAVESLGFFFSGVGPWMLGGHDALRLQLPLTPIDLSALVVVGEFGKILLNYIASERDRVAGTRR